MQCPFPGMDPYIERREIWPDFHDSLIFCLREALQPQLYPRYAALTQNRLYVVEHERPIYPDVSIVRTEEPGGVAVAPTLVADQPIVVEVTAEEIRQPLLQIVEPAAGDRVVTSIEVLSPDNKTAGPGLRSYLEKREELWSAGAHTVEIDLLREGTRPRGVSESVLTERADWRYLVSVWRQPKTWESYPIPLRSRLPNVSIPLAPDDADVVLDLQSAFARAWQTGPYPALLRYHQPPPGPMSEAERSWCREHVARALKV